MFCSRCGTNLPDDAKFCSVCGTSTSGAPQVIHVTEYAGFWRRFGARLIDQMVLFIPSMVLFFFVGFDTFFDLADFDQADIWDLIRNFIWLGIKLSFLNFLMEWLYEAIMVSSTSQATLGKMAIGIIVTDEDGKRISFGRATARYFGKFLSGLILNIGYIMAGFTQKKQALHDMIAETLVVKKRELHVV